MTGDGNRAFVFGDNVDTDALAPGLYMKAPIAELAKHCLETVEPRFAKEARSGDIVVAGRNFGMGSSREQAVLALRELGIGAVVARSFAGIFYRNAINLGLLALVCRDAQSIPAGAAVSVDRQRAVVTVLESGKALACEPLPPHLLDIVASGGLLPYLERRLRSEAPA